MHARTHTQCHALLKISTNDDTSNPHSSGNDFASGRLRAQFLLKSVSEFPKDAGVTTPWQTFGIPFAVTPLSQLTSLCSSPLRGNKSKVSLENDKMALHTTQLIFWRFIIDHMFS